ncbi:uncharacterized protein LOC143460017 [Clavelina lepadiformis]|uniref:uncharacterized protein LOC143460017 n=1 Tax=Clavelina lepadiformis TaxID=159417 RepID=UPI0040425D8B
MGTHYLTLCTLALTCGLASATDNCGGGYYCPDSRTYCCGYYYCCTYVYALWYFWFGMVLGVVFLVSCCGACIRCMIKPQRQAQTGTIHVATTTARVPYPVGHQNTSYVDNSMPSPYQSQYPPQQYGMAGMQQMNESKMAPPDYTTSSVNNPAPLQPVTTNYGA